MVQIKDFSFDFVSDTRFEELAVEVSFQGQRFFQLNREKGIENIEVEFLSDIRLLSEEVGMIFPLRIFEEVLREAVDALKSCA